MPRQIEPRSSYARDEAQRALHLRKTLDFVMWALARRRITRDDIMTRFECSRSTAYRWLRAWKDARGEP